MGVNIIQECLRAEGSLSLTKARGVLGIVAGVGKIQA
jgi:hypothetical protein